MHSENITKLEKSLQVKIDRAKNNLMECEGDLKYDIM